MDQTMQIQRRTTKKTSSNPLPIIPVRPANRVHGKQAVAPDVDRRPARALRERLKTFDRVFVAVLGMDGLAKPESDRLAVHAHFLPLQTGKMHFDAAAFAVVARMMLERGQIEIAAEFAIDAGEQVEIELRGDPFGIVVSRPQDRAVLDQIDPDNQNGSLAECHAGMTQELHRLMTFEVAD